MIVEHFMRERPHPTRWKVSISTGGRFALLTPAAGASVEIPSAGPQDRLFAALRMTQKKKAARIWSMDPHPTLEDERRPLPDRERLLGA